MIILGIDPGSRITGYGVIDASGRRPQYVDSGCIRMKTDEPMANRLLTIFQGVDQLIALYRPEVLSIEEVFLHKGINEFRLLFRGWKQQFVELDKR